MNAQILLPCLLLLCACGAYIFWPQRQPAGGVLREKSRLDYLREWREVIYENLRDLNFEFRSGKFPEEDYGRQREALEQEAAQVLAEMDALGG